MRRSGCARASDISSDVPILALAGTAWLLLVVKLDQILKIRFCNPQ